MPVLRRKPAGGGKWALWKQRTNVREERGRKKKPNVCTHMNNRPHLRLEQRRNGTKWADPEVNVLKKARDKSNSTLKEDCRR